MNRRPLGYEPNELPDCSTPQSKLKYKLGFGICQVILGEKPLRQTHRLLTENELEIKLSQSKEEGVIFSKKSGVVLLVLVGLISLAPLPRKAKGER